MRTRSAPELLIEWAPGRVRSYDPVTGAENAAASIAGLASAAPHHRRAVVGVSRDRVFLRTLALPKAPPEDLRRIVAAQIGQSFPLPASDLSFDFVQSAERAADGWPTMVAAVRTSDLTQILAEMKSAAMSAVRIVPAALAAPILAAAAGIPEALVVETGPHGLSIDVVRGGILQLSRTASAGCDVDAEIQRTIAAVGSDAIQILRAGELEADGALMAGLGEVHGFCFELPEEQERVVQRRAASRNRLVALTAVAAALLSAVAWFDYSTAAGAVRRVQDRYNKEQTTVRAARDTQTARAQQAAEARAVLSKALEPGQPLSDIMAVVADRQPAGVWLTGLGVERGKPIQIRGISSRSTAIAEFMAALGSTPRLADARLVSANTAKIGQSPVVQFSISAIGVGNPTMPTPAVKAKKAARGSKTHAESGTGDKR